MSMQFNTFDPYRVLNVDMNHATDEAVHQAYLEAVRHYPPDKRPEEFKRIREAYEAIKTSEKRIELMLFGIKSNHSFHDLLPEDTNRKRIGADLWISMIETEAKRME